MNDHQIPFRIIPFIACIFLVTNQAYPQTTVTLDADGPGNTYELLSQKLGGTPYEVPDCGHPEFGRHITEEWDDILQQYVFVFYIHAAIDNDRCTNFDRQRNEIKTYGPSPANLKGTQGEIHIYQWKFKIDSLFQPSPNFCHLFQIKASGGSDDGAPIITITPRYGSPDKLQIIFTPSSGGSGGGTVKEVPLAPIKGKWVQAYCRALYSDQGKLQIILKLLDGTPILSYENQNIDMWRLNADFNRPKWGIYRSLNSPSYLRDEAVRFANFSITEGEINEVPAVPGNLTATATSSHQVSLTWDDLSNVEKNFLVQRSIDGAAWSNVASLDSNLTTYTDKGLDGETVYHYRVRAENWNAYSAFSDVDTAKTLSSDLELTPSWHHGDIGFPSIDGSAIDSAGVFIIQGAGNDIYGTSDQFHFVYQKLSGDGMITARVIELTKTHTLAKAGVMIRESLDNNSKHAMVAATPQGSTLFQYRLTTGGTTPHKTGNTSALPHWVRLARRGFTFTGYESTDGTTWNEIGSADMDMKGVVYVGLLACSRNATQSCTTRIADVSVTTDTTGDPSVWIETENSNITSPMFIGQDYEASGGQYIAAELGNKSTDSAPTEGRITYAFHLSTAGDYRLWGRVIAPDTGTDSYWIRMDAMNWVKWNEIEITSVWKWAQVHDSDNGNTPVLFSLDAGDHTITVAYREPGTLLDKLLLTHNLSFDPNSDEIPVEVAAARNNIPSQYRLYPAFPNPFNPGTCLRYDLSTADHVSLKIYNIAGQVIETLVDAYQTAGTYRVTWNTADQALTSGQYFAVLKAGSYQKTQKLMLMK